MRVPNGFKQTEVGVIPKDWEIHPLESITDTTRPISYGIVQTGACVTGGVRCLRVLDINNGKINKTNLITTSKQISIAYKRTVLKLNDLVMPLRGKVGDVGQIDRELVGCNLTRGVALIAIRPQWSAGYCRQVISSCSSRSRMEQLMNGSALQEIPIATLRSFKIPLPPTRAEQTAIATALSDIDALIEGVEKLLEKKRRIKQGAMQELLRPKEGWKIHKLDELCTPSKKRIDPKISQQVYKCVELEHIGQESGRLLGYAFTDELKSQKTLFNAGDTLFGKLRPYLKKFLFAGFDGCCTTEIWALQPANYIYGKLLFYIIQTDAVLEAANQSEGTKMPRADWKKVKEVKISIPPKPEQERIAAILSDMDSEIVQLETQLVKYRQLKTGMMQELLTGKKRLV